MFFITRIGLLYHHDLSPHLPSDGWFNTRRTRLGPLIEQIRRVLTDQWGLINDDPLRVVDSLPIPIITYARGKRSRTIDGQEYYGVQASGHATLFGFRLVLSSTPEQVITDWILVPTAVHDSQTVGAMGTEWAACTVLGDGAFHAPMVTPILDTRAVTMRCPPRRNARSGRWPRALRAAHTQLSTRLRRVQRPDPDVCTQTPQLAVAARTGEPYHYADLGLYPQSGHRTVSVHPVFGENPELE